MKTEQLTVSDPRLLAEFIAPAEMKTFFEKRFEVPPDHLGLLMRNGQFVQAYRGAHFSVGGVWHQMKGLIGGSSSCCSACTNALSVLIIVCTGGARSSGVARCPRMIMA